MSDSANDTAKTAEDISSAPQIRIINRAHEGFRRGGIAHPADATYPADAFSPEQLEIMRAEPLLTVIMGDGAEASIKASKRRK